MAQGCHSMKYPEREANENNPNLLFIHDLIFERFPLSFGPPDSTTPPQCIALYSERAPNQMETKWKRINSMWESYSLKSQLHFLNRINWVLITRLLSYSSCAAFTYSILEEAMIHSKDLEKLPEAIISSKKLDHIHLPTLLSLFRRNSSSITNYSKYSEIKKNIIKQFTSAARMLHQSTERELLSFLSHRLPTTDYERIKATMRNTVLLSSPPFSKDKRSSEKHNILPDKKGINEMTLDCLKPHALPRADPSQRIIPIVPKESSKIIEKPFMLQSNVVAAVSLSDTSVVDSLKRIDEEDDNSNLVPSSNFMESEEEKTPNTPLFSMISLYDALPAMEQEEPKPRQRFFSHDTLNIQRIKTETKASPISVDDNNGNRNDYMYCQPSFKGDCLSFGESNYRIDLSDTVSITLSDSAEIQGETDSFTTSAFEGTPESTRTLIDDEKDLLYSTLSLVKNADRKASRKRIKARLSVNEYRGGREAKKITIPTLLLSPSVLRRFYGIMTKYKLLNQRQENGEQNSSLNCCMCSSQKSHHGRRNSQKRQNEEACLNKNIQRHTDGNQFFLNSNSKLQNETYTDASVQFVANRKSRRRRTETTRHFLQGCNNVEFPSSSVFSILKQYHQHSKYLQSCITSPPLSQASSSQKVEGNNLSNINIINHFGIGSVIQEETTEGGEGSTSTRMQFNTMIREDIDSNKGLVVEENEGSRPTIRCKKYDAETKKEEEIKLLGIDNANMAECGTHISFGDSADEAIGKYELSESDVSEQEKMGDWGYREDQNDQGQEETHQITTRDLDEPPRDEDEDIFGIRRLSSEIPKRKKGRVNILNEEFYLSIFPAKDEHHISEILYSLFLSHTAQMDQNYKKNWNVTINTSHNNTAPFYYKCSNISEASTLINGDEPEADFAQYSKYYNNKPPTASIGRIIREASQIVESYLLEGDVVIEERSRYANIDRRIINKWYHNEMISTKRTSKTPNEFYACVINKDLYRHIISLKELDLSSSLDKIDLTPSHISHSSISSNGLSPASLIGKTAKTVSDHSGYSSADHDYSPLVQRNAVTSNERSVATFTDHTNSSISNIVNATSIDNSLGTAVDGVSSSPINIEKRELVISPISFSLSRMGIYIAKQYSLKVHSKSSSKLAEKTVHHLLNNSNNSRLPFSVVSSRRKFDLSQVIECDIEGDAYLISNGDFDNINPYAHVGRHCRSIIHDVTFTLLSSYDNEQMMCYRSHNQSQYNMLFSYYESLKLVYSERYDEAFNSLPHSYYKKNKLPFASERTSHRYLNEPHTSSRAKKSLKHHATKDSLKSTRTKDPSTSTRTQGKPSSIRVKEVSSIHQPKEHSSARLKEAISSARPPERSALSSKIASFSSSRLDSLHPSDTRLRNINASLRLHQNTSHISRPRYLLAQQPSPVNYNNIPLIEIPRKISASAHLSTPSIKDNIDKTTPALFVLIRYNKKTKDDGSSTNEYAVKPSMIQERKKDFTYEDKNENVHKSTQNKVFLSPNEPNSPNTGEDTIKQGSHNRLGVHGKHFDFHKKELGIDLVQENKDNSLLDTQIRVKKKQVDIISLTTKEFLTSLPVIDNGINKSNTRLNVLMSLTMDDLLSMSNEELMRINKVNMTRKMSSSQAQNISRGSMEIDYQLTSCFPLIQNKEKDSIIERDKTTVEQTLPSDTKAQNLNTGSKIPLMSAYTTSNSKSEKHNPPAHSHTIASLEERQQNCSNNVIEYASHPLKGNQGASSTQVTAIPCAEVYKTISFDNSQQEDITVEANEKSNEVLFDSKINNVYDSNFSFSENTDTKLKEKKRELQTLDPQFQDVYSHYKSTQWEMIFKQGLKLIDDGILNLIKYTWKEYYQQKIQKKLRNALCHYVSFTSASSDKEVLNKCKKYISKKYYSRPYIIPMLDYNVLGRDESIGEPMAEMRKPPSTKITIIIEEKERKKSAQLTEQKSEEGEKDQKKSREEGITQNPSPLMKETLDNTQELSSSNKKVVNRDNTEIMWHLAFSVLVLAFLSYCFYIYYCASFRKKKYKKTEVLNNEEPLVPAVDNDSMSMKRNAIQDTETNCCIIPHVQRDRSLINQNIPEYHNSMDLMIVSFHSHSNESRRSSDATYIM